MYPVLDTPVTVKVNVPLDLVEPDLKVTRPVGPVVPVAVPDVSPDHVPVTVAPDSGPPVLDWIVTTAFANVDGFFPVPVVLDMARPATRAVRRPAIARGALVVLTPRLSVVLTVTENVVGTEPV